MIAAPEGLVFFSSTYQTDAMFAILAGLMAFARLTNFLFSAVERSLLVWQRP
jgi:ABC-type nitrate/sulfonate/bicarbonate transport system permease component